MIEGDIRRRTDLEQAFAAGASTGAGVDAVIHFAGLKAVGESVAEPLRYWDVNDSGSQRLLAAMSTCSCRMLVFSSSTTLYGDTKAAVEQILCDVAASEENWRISCLRYLNPVDAHLSGRIGEDPNGIFNI